MKIIVATSGRINEILKGVPNEEFMGIATQNEKAWVVLKSDVIPMAAGEVKIVEKEVEVIKEVDNPKLLTNIQELEDLLEFKDDKIKKSDESIQTLQDALADALNAEEKAKKEAETLKKQIPKLKAQVSKLKNLIAED